MREILKAPSINRGVATLDRSPTWMNKIIYFSRDGTIPEDDLDDSHTTRGSCIKNHSHAPLLRCLTPQERDYVLREIHQGACGSHQGARTLTAKALRAGHYWPTMRADASKMVQKCNDCQMHANLPHQAASSLTTI